MGVIGLKSHLMDCWRGKMNPPHLMCEASDINYTTAAPRLACFAVLSTFLTISCLVNKSNQNQNRQFT